MTLLTQCKQLRNVFFFFLLNKISTQQLLRLKIFHVLASVCSMWFCLVVPSQKRGGLFSWPYLLQGLPYLILWLLPLLLLLLVRRPLLENLAVGKNKECKRKEATESRYNNGCNIKGWGV